MRSGKKLTQIAEKERGALFKRGEGPTLSVTSRTATDHTKESKLSSLVCHLSALVDQGAKKKRKKNPSQTGPRLKESARVHPRKSARRQGRGL